MRIIEGFDRAKELLSRQARASLEYPQEATVRRIIAEVRRRGDAALFELTEKFDGA
ncbi:MAG: histidinol dehydrogenase, partial [Dehalococcoidia bacterium]|nr:histidinol dehydrogenase [Dehalococcoidia bacterium]